MIVFLWLQPTGSILSDIPPIEPAWAWTGAELLSGYTLTKINFMSGYTPTKNKFMKEYHKIRRYTAPLMVVRTLRCITVTSDKIW